MPAELLSATGLASGYNKVQVLWGAKGALGAWYDTLAVWREWAPDLRGQALDCGHFLPEERPGETLTALRSFHLEGRT